MSAWKVSEPYMLLINITIVGKCAAHPRHAQSDISFGDKSHRGYKWLVHGHTTMKRHHSNPSILIPSPVAFILLPSAFAVSVEGLQLEGKIIVWWGENLEGFLEEMSTFFFFFPLEEISLEGRGAWKAFQGRSVWWAQQTKVLGTSWLAEGLNCEECWDTNWDRQRGARLEDEPWWQAFWWPSDGVRIWVGGPQEAPVSSWARGLVIIKQNFGKKERNLPLLRVSMGQKVG